MKSIPPHSLMLIIVSHFPLLREHLNVAGKCKTEFAFLYLGLPFVLWGIVNCDWVFFLLIASSASDIYTTPTPAFLYLMGCFPQIQ